VEGTKAVERRSRWGEETEEEVQVVAGLSEGERAADSGGQVAYFILNSGQTLPNSDVSARSNVLRFHVFSLPLPLPSALLSGGNFPPLSSSLISEAFNDRRLTRLGHSAPAARRSQRRFRRDLRLLPRRHLRRLTIGGSYEGSFHMDNTPTSSECDASLSGPAPG